MDIEAFFRKTQNVLTLIGTVVLSFTLIVLMLVEIFRR